MSKKIIIAPLFFFYFLLISKFSHSQVVLASYSGGTYYNTTSYGYGKTVTSYATWCKATVSGKNMTIVIDPNTTIYARNTNISASVMNEDSIYSSIDIYVSQNGAPYNPSPTTPTTPKAPAASVVISGPSVVYEGIFTFVATLENSSATNVSYSWEIDNGSSISATIDGGQGTGTVNVKLGAVTGGGTISPIVLNVFTSNGLSASYTLNYVP